MRDFTKILLTITATSVLTAGTAWAQQTETPETETEVTETQELTIVETDDAATMIDASSEKTVEAETIELIDDSEAADIVEEIEPAADATTDEADIEEPAEELEGPDRT